MTEDNVLAQISDSEVYIGTYGDKWVAATGRAPYFCLEADSVNALNEKLTRLIAFAHRATDHVHGTREREKSKTFVLKKKITLKELEAA